MTTHDRDKVIAAAKEAGLDFLVDQASELLGLFYAIAFEDGRLAEREDMFPHEDTIRLEFMEAFGGECVCQLGSQFYYRAGFQQPNVKADTLREAIDGAIRARGDSK